ncbi:MAG TPA: hypothetical protein VF950_09685 [Planctomycetota bacterium]
MAHLPNIPILKLTDAEIFQKVREASESLSLALKNVQVSLPFVGGDPVSFTPAQIGTDARITSVLAQNSRIIAWATFVFTNDANVRFDRQPDTSFDKLQINFPNNNDLAGFFAFGKPFREKLGEPEVVKILPITISEEAKKDLAARKEGLAQLEVISRGFVETLKKETTEQWSKLNTLRGEDAARLKTREEELENKYKEKDAALQKKEEAIEQRRKDIDDRDYKHARRQGLKDQKARFTELGKTFTLTDTTSKKRWPVTILYILLSASFAIGAGLFTYKSFSQSGIDYLTYAKQVAFTLAFATTVGFYIRWQNAWFREHASEEFRLKRLEMDIDRASWVYEMALEWQYQNKSEIPQYLMEKLAHNLFREEGLRADGDKDADTLGSAIIRGTKSLSMKIGENQLSLQNDPGKTKSRKG